MRRYRHIYVASSWHNPRHTEVVDALRGKGHWVYDYREGNSDFRWESVDPKFEQWTPGEYLRGLSHPCASKAFWQDMNALICADAVVGLGPLGVSSALEIGWAVGQGKPTILFTGEIAKPELMCKMIPYRVASLEDLFVTLDNLT